jgi:hypothetical protein
MQEFSSISVSQYEAGSLAGQLTEQSRDGWSVVSIVSTGSTVTAYLSRFATNDTVSAAPAELPEVAESSSEPESAPEAETTPEPDPVVDVMPDIAPAPATSDSATSDAVSGWASSSEITPSAAEPALPSSGSGVTPEPAASTPAAAAGGAPAGWYADPSSRFELRYWDGGQWTEHVSRAGQQYTDPPVA